ncbi:ankyrin repeat domain-containing protein [Herminiimonas fonticola]|uniref:ankyrin repeat domain-containing protein n=1 Tax=Herminiimonas fonticola TaxID=303380 RepID=UPI00334176F3
MRRCSLQLLVAISLAASLPMQAYAGAYDDYFQAVKADDVAVVTSLLQRGFDPNTVEPERGDSGLVLAVREKAMKVFAVLLQARGTDVDLKINNGDTALMIAAYTANKQAVAALLAKDAAVNRSGWTPLHYAAASGDDDIVKMLLDKAAIPDAPSPNKTTPMMMAARGGHIYVVKTLLDAGADATLKNDAGMTAIDFARQSGNQDIVEGLTYRLKKAGKL